MKKTKDYNEHLSYDSKVSELTRSFFVAGLCFLSFAGLPDLADAATYYVDSAVADDTGDGSAIHPKKYVTSGLVLLNGGDTLVLKDGVYTGENNMIGDYANPRKFPPSGLGPSNYTVIKAEHVGGAIIDAEYLRFAFSNYNSAKINYLRIEGIHFRHGLGGVFNLMGDYNKVLRCGFEDGQPASSDTESPIAFIAGNSSNTLVEDSWVWGKGRYGFYTNSTGTGTKNVILRRLVIRLDDTPHGHVCAGTRFYKADTNVAQNVFVLDSQPDACSYFEGAFAMGGGASNGEPNHSYYGVAAINNALWDGFFPDKSMTSTTVQNALFWGNGGNGATAVPTTAGVLNESHITSGKNTGNGFRSNTAYASVINVTDTISYGNSGSGFKDINSVDTVNVYGNAVVPCEGCTAANGNTTNPLATVAGSSNPALKYLVRIESGSALIGAAKDGGSIGATIVKRIGASESLYGDADWNLTTNDNLWPWPDEDIWIPKMRAYTATGSGGNRGFAATGQTLTNYVWGYFNYDGDPSTPEVTVPPFNFQTRVGDKKVTLTWDPPAPIALPTITGYKIYDVTGKANPVIPGSLSPIATVTGNTTYSAVLTGLTNQTTYDFAVTAVGSAGESSYSYIVSATPTSLEISQPIPGFIINLSNRSSFLIEGHAPSNAAVDLFAQNSSIGSVTAGNDGYWSTRIDFSTLPIPEGSVSLKAVSGTITTAPVVGTLAITPPSTPVTPDVTIVK